MTIEIYSAEARRVIERVVRTVLGNTPQAARGSVAASVMRLAKTGAGGVTARSSDTPGTGPVTLYELDTDGDLSEKLDSNGAAVSKTCRNLSTGAVAANSYVMVSQDLLTGSYWAIWEDC